MDLLDLGWNDDLARAFGQYNTDLVPGRVASQFRHTYYLCTEYGRASAEVTGKLRYEADSPAEFPVVGDWVGASFVEGWQQALIHSILPRKTAFSRKVAGAETVEQVIASNIDTVFLVMGLDGDFNLRRLERYLAVAWSSGATPVVVLNKTDICKSLESALNQARGVAVGASVVAVSATTGEGMEAFSYLLKPGETAVLLGSSGVGKSSIINRLVGEERLEVQEVRPGDSRGRHTTTHRELIVLPHGGLIIDTPGMRELQLWDADEGIQGSFDDIEQLAAGCRFADCSHQQEPGCAVKAALKDGRLDQGRFLSYVKLQKELAYIARKKDILAQRAEKQKWKHIQQAARERNRYRW